MRWERLFDDLEARFEAEERAAAESELSDLIRSERAALALADRLRAHVGESLSWSLAGGGAPRPAEVLDVGVDWVLLREGHGDLVIPTAAVQFVAGLTRSASLDSSEVARRWGLRSLLRGLARDRATVRVLLTGGQAFSGTIDRVGADYCDVAVHPEDVGRRNSAVLALRAVPIPAILSVAVR